MIRINLLGGERDKPRGKASAFLQVGQKLTVACSLMLLAAALGIVWWYWSLQTESERLDADIASATEETTRLQSVLQQVTLYEQRRATIEQRVALIEQLRKGQSGPVHMLDEISRSLPDRLWLTELRQKEADLAIDGRAVSLSAVSDFVGNLEASGYFRRPVVLVSTQVETQPQKGSGELIRFSLKAVFSAPGS